MDIKKSCDNCILKEVCDYEYGECIGLDGVPKKWRGNLNYE